jgi:glycosyltransferase involved in cell wall biosynthesis
MHDTLRIAQIGPVEEKIPPFEGYGGTERVVHNLTEGLVACGHEVTLLASGDSQTNARLVPCTPSAVRRQEEAKDHATRLAMNYHGLYAAMMHLKDHEYEYDIIHNHFYPEWKAMILRRMMGIRAPMVSTFHGSLEDPALQYVYRNYGYYNDEPIVSISDNQREPLANAGLNYIRTVHHGVDTERLAFSDSPSDDLAFLGLIHPNKGIEEAMAVSLATGRRLMIAAKIDPTNIGYYKAIVKPVIRKNKDHIIELGEVGEAIQPSGKTEKAEFLGNAYALLNLVRWREPFGLVAVESMACGTPVIARPGGALVETVVDGTTGFLRERNDDIVDCVDRVRGISRLACRRHVEQNFSIPRMVHDYEEVYEKVIAAQW